MKGKAPSKMPAHKMPNGGMMAGKSHPKDMPMTGAMPKGMAPKEHGADMNKMAPKEHGLAQKGGKRGK